MIYEYRRYDAEPGRLADLSARFENVTLDVFERHGFDPIGFWTTDVGQSNQFHYLLRFGSHDHRQTAWTALQSDEDWLEAKRASEVNGVLAGTVHNQLWKPTGYSALG